MSACTMWSRIFVDDGFSGQPNKNTNSLSSTRRYATQTCVFREKPTSTRTRERFHFFSSGRVRSRQKIRTVCSVDDCDVRGARAHIIIDPSVANAARAQFEARRTLVVDSDWPPIRCVQLAVASQSVSISGSW